METGLKRHEDWPKRLADAVEALRAEPFEWGELNCVFGAAAIVEACTGVDLAAPWRPDVETALDAGRLIAAEGGLPALVDACGLERWSCPQMARRLDVGLCAFDRSGAVVDYLKRPLRSCVGVVVDSRVVYMGKTGLVWRPASELQIAWKVGGAA